MLGKTTHFDYAGAAKIVPVQFRDHVTDLLLLKQARCMAEISGPLTAQLGALLKGRLEWTH